MSAKAIAEGRAQDAVNIVFRGADIVYNGDNGQQVIDSRKEDVLLRIDYSGGGAANAKYSIVGFDGKDIENSNISIPLVDASPGNSNITEKYAGKRLSTYPDNTTKFHLGSNQSVAVCDSPESIVQATKNEQIIKIEPGYTDKENKTNGFFDTKDSSRFFKMCNDGLYREFDIKTGLCSNLTLDDSYAFAYDKNSNQMQLYKDSEL